MKQQLIYLCVAAMIGLGGCGNDTSHENHASSNESNHEQMDHNHSSSGEVPEGLQEAANPTYKVGSQAMIKADHMEGMNGAEATIVGAYETTAYAVSYTPTTGGERVENHKWVIQEEIQNAGDETFQPKTEVILEADHMKGMKGAAAEIEFAEQTTVYMIDYTSTTDGEKVTNHKWVTESELAAK